VREEYVFKTPALHFKYPNTLHKVEQDYMLQAGNKFLSKGKGELIASPSCNRFDTFN